VYASATRPRAESRKANSVSPNRVSSVVLTSRRAMSRMASAERVRMRAANSWARASSSGGRGSLTAALQGQFPSIPQAPAEVNSFPTNFRDAYPAVTHIGRGECTEVGEMIVCFPVPHRGKGAGWWA
jgi:hypothetical protein